MIVPPLLIGGSNPYTGIGFDPNFKGSQYSLSLDRLTASNSSGRGTVLTAKGFSSPDQPYCEFLVNSGTFSAIGVADHSVTLNGTFSSLGFDAHGWSYLNNPGAPDFASFKTHNAVSVLFGTLVVPTDIVMVAMNMSTLKVWFGLNGSWIGVGADPAAGTGEAFSSLSATMYFAVSNYNGNASNITMNSGATPFAYTPPSGYSGF